MWVELWLIIVSHLRHSFDCLFAQLWFNKAHLVTHYDVLPVRVKVLSVELRDYIWFWVVYICDRVSNSNAWFNAIFIINTGHQRIVGSFALSVGLEASLLFVVVGRKLSVFWVVLMVSDSYLRTLPRGGCLEDHTVILSWYLWVVSGTLLSQAIYIWAVLHGLVRDLRVIVLPNPNSCIWEVLFRYTALELMIISRALILCDLCALLDLRTQAWASSLLLRTLPRVTLVLFLVLLLLFRVRHCWKPALVSFTACDQLLFLLVSLVLLLRLLAKHLFLILLHLKVLLHALLILSDANVHWKFLGPDAERLQV